MTRQDRVDEIVGAWQLARDEGTAADPAEVVAEHPDLAEELWARFAALDLLDRMLRESRLSGGALERIGDYRVLREIGRGGMGVVYEAEQGSMRRRVALKVLYPKITGSAEAVKRFQREARASGRLHHTNIVPVYDLGCADDLWFYSMEVVDGLSLAQILKGMRQLGGGPKGPAPREEGNAELVPEDGAETEEQSPGTSSFGTDSGTLPWYRRVARAFEGVAEGLEAAHAEGVIHRDIKPSNLILDADGTLKIIDFGLARIVGSQTAVTATGERLGTPLYMSPEQARNEKVDHRSDVYSLGATLYELLTLHAPHEARGDRQVIAAILSRDPPPPRRWHPQIPRDLETIVTKAIEKEPRRRYETAEEMAADLRAFADDDAIRARHIGPMGRAWRKVRRHKVVSSLSALVLLLGVAGLALNLRALREESQRRDAEYRLLLTRAERALAWSGDTRSRLYSEARSDSGALALFDAAIAVDAERPEAWLGRALTTDRSLELRLADIEAASIRGLAPRIAHLARACVLIDAGRHDEAEAERARARGLPASGAADAYFQGRLLLATGDERGGIKRLGAAIETAGEDSLYRYLALLRRARAREEAGDLEGALEDLSAVVLAGDNTFGVRITRAALWRQLDREERAEAILQQVLEEVRRRDRVEWWQLAAWVCPESELRWKERFAREGLRLHSDDVGLMMELMRALRDAGRRDDQIEICSRIHHLDATHAEALFDWGDALYALSRFEEAIGKYDAAEARGLEDAALFNNRGIALAQLGRYEEAIRGFERAIALGMMTADCYANLSGALKDLQRFEEALEWADKAIEIDGEGHLGHALRGAALYGLGRVAEALECFDRSLALDSNEPFVHDWHGKVLVALGRYPDALAAFDRELARDPRYAPSLADSARVLSTLGNGEEALARATSATSFAPEDYWAQATHARILVNLGRFEESLPLSAIAERLWSDDRGGLNPDHLTEILCARATALVQLGRHAEGVEVFDRLLKHDSEHTHVLAMRAQALERLDRFEEAIEGYRAAAYHGPSSALILDDLGTLLLRLGRYDEAIAAYRESIAIDPDWSLATDRGLTRPGELSLCLFYSGRTAEARDHVAKLIDALPDISDLRMMQARNLVWLGSMEEAEAEFAKACEIGLNSTNARAWSIEIALTQGNAPLALRAARRLALQDPEGHAWLQVQCLRALGEHEEARAVARETLVDDPPPGARLQNAYLRAVLGQREKALRLLESVTRPGYGQDALLRARVHAVLGDTEEAARWITIAAEKGFALPDAATVHPDLGTVIEKVGAARPQSR